MRPEMKARVDAVWEHGTPLDQPLVPIPWRYIPRSYSGGSGWGVFDRKTERFINDDDLLRIPLDSLKNEILPGLVS